MQSTLILVAFLSSGFSQIVNINQGTLHGTYLTARNGKVFKAYYGIPFAEPPIGFLRLKPPVIAKGWKGIRDASITPSPCIQWNNTSNQIIGSEDCLYLNVYTPLKVKSDVNLSTIVYIYGGSYKQGSNIENGPGYIMQEDVILVMPNYREGVLGFLSTGDSVISGNFGLKDQSMALRWVEQNIHEFGGDPNKITLQGHSSGAVNVHLHTLSPMSTGLFQKVIILSGSGICSLSYFGPDVVKAIAKEFALKAGCKTKTSQDILNCVMSLDAEMIPSIPEKMYIWDLDPDAAFRPTIESPHVENPFLTEFPEKLQYQSPNLPWIIGLTTGEGAFKAARYLDNDNLLAKKLDENYELLFPITLQYLWNTQPKSLDFTSEIIRQRYFKNNTISNETAASLTKLYTDGLFGFCMVDTIHNYPGPKYVYWYDYRSNYSTQNLLGYYPEYLGVSHGDEVHLLFYRSCSASLLSPQDITFSDEIIKRFLNFVDSENPNHPRQINETIMSYWHQMSTERVEYLFMKLNGTMQKDLYKYTYQFWKSLPIKNKYLT